MTEPIYSQHPPSVLMVDDTPANLELLSGMLKGRGYKVRAAVNGELALRAVRNDPPELILLDITMPGMNGYEVCAQLKSDEKLKDIPVIFLSALNETMDKVKAFSAGGVDYITKPFQFEEVEARVEVHMELRRQKILLQENYGKLRALEELRDNLVNMIVHDLRSPLTGICGCLQLLKEDTKSKLSPDSLRYVAETAKATKQLIQMISDILDTSKMEAGQMKLNKTECDLGRLLEEGTSGMKSLFTGGEVRLIHPETPVKLTADREMILRVIQNLLGNAIKFTPKKGGLIQLEIKTEAGVARVTIENNGPSIAPEYRQKIFEKFAQVELRAGHQRNSTGLGLTFCKLAVEAHGGRIGVEGEEGKGCTFWFELPITAPVSK